MTANAASPLLAESPAAVVSSNLEQDYDLRHGVACALVSWLVGLTQGMGIFLVNNNLTGIQGSLSATATEAGWLTSAYYATSLSAVVLLTKMRLQFGLRRFAEWGIVGYLAVSVVNLVVRDLPTALEARAALGFAAAPLTTLSLLYMLEAFPKRLSPVGLTLGFASLQFGAPLSRIVSESLLQNAAWRGLQLLDVGMACACLAAIIAVHLTPPPRIRVLCPGDALSFVLYAAALALISVVCTQARAAWWTDSAWLGVWLAGGIVAFGLFIVVELLRPHPLIDLRWVCSPSMLKLMLTVLLFRVVLSEQPVGAVTLMNVLGFINDQMHPLFVWVVAGTALGFGLSLFAVPSMSLRAPALVALVLIFVAALLDAESTSQTRPGDLYVSQTLLAMGTAMFLMSTLLSGFIPVIQDGMRNVVSFLAVFSMSQQLGSLIGSAALGSFVVMRQRVHFEGLAQSVVLADPQIVQRVAENAATYGGGAVEQARGAALGLSTLGQQVSRESFVLAYDDVFMLVAILATTTFVWLLTDVVWDLAARRGWLNPTAARKALRG